MGQVLDLSRLSKDSQVRQKDTLENAMYKIFTGKVRNHRLLPAIRYVATKEKDICVTTMYDALMQPVTNDKGTKVVEVRKWRWEFYTGKN